MSQFSLHSQIKETFQATGALVQRAVISRTWHVWGNAISLISLSWLKHMYIHAWCLEWNKKKLDGEFGTKFGKISFALLRHLGLVL